MRAINTVSASLTASQARTLVPRLLAKACWFVEQPLPNDCVLVTIEAGKDTFEQSNVPPAQCSKPRVVIVPEFK